MTLWLTSRDKFDMRILRDLKALKVSPCFCRTPKPQRQRYCNSCVTGILQFALLLASRVGSCTQDLAGPPYPSFTMHELNETCNAHINMLAPWPEHTRHEAKLMSQCGQCEMERNKQLKKHTKRQGKIKSGKAKTSAAS